MVGEDSSRLLGAMIITKLQLAAMSRQNIPEEEREDFTFMLMNFKFCYRIFAIFYPKRVNIV